MFVFFDQVHTTGMDVKQAVDAKAVVTLGIAFRSLVLAVDRFFPALTPCR